MKNKLTFLIISMICFASYGQLSFEKGYFIDNNDNKIICYINNKDWRNNPRVFKYKISENDKTLTGTIELVKEFAVDNVFRYERSIVAMDRSSDNPNKLSRQRAPKFNQEELYLRVLVSGDATLYSYVEGNLQRFFYRIKGSQIDQLIYKKFTTTKYDLRINERYKQQLFEHLSCENITKTKIEKLDYKKNDLTKFFLAYNSCNGMTEVYSEKENERKAFKLSIRPGLNISAFSVVNATKPYYNVHADFGTEAGFRIGVEGEYIIPFWNGKWTLIMEANYQYYKSETEVEAPNDNVTYDSEKIYIDYKSIEVPLGIRYYFVLGQKSRVFLNASVVFDFPIDSEVIFEESTRCEPEVDGSMNFAIGLGYSFNSKFSLELRYLTDRDILSRKNYNLPSNYTTTSLILGYTIF